MLIIKVPSNSAWIPMGHNKGLVDSSLSNWTLFTRSHASKAKGRDGHMDQDKHRGATQCMWNTPILWEKEWEIVWKDDKVSTVCFYNTWALFSWHCPIWFQAIWENSQSILQVRELKNQSSRNGHKITLSPWSTKATYRLAGFYSSPNIIKAF